MIISHIAGGLGNQMFQYAAARALALQNNVPLKLDVSYFSPDSLHNGFELKKVFGIESSIASEGDFYDAIGWRGLKYFRKLILSSKGKFLRGKKLIKEPDISYWPGLIKAPKNCYLKGYWQSAKYFSDYSEQIKSDFTFIENIKGLNQQIANEIGDNNSVSIHVRRGDYLFHTKSTYYNCPKKYYDRAISYIAQKVKEPVFFIFSDDPEWVKAKFDINFPFTAIGNNQGAKSYNDMRLMSLCKHHIIANSSFSWWGAWLSETNNEDKIVIAPKFWFRKNSHNPAKSIFKLINNVE